MDRINFKLRNRELFIEIPRDTPSERLSQGTLESTFHNSSYHTYRLDQDTWTHLSRRFNQEKQKNTEPIITLRIGESRAAQLTLKLSDDAMEAEAVVEAPYGGHSLVTEQVLNQLRHAGIVNGIRRRAIEAIVTHSKEAPPGATLSVIIAKGKQPLDGTDTSFKKLVEDVRTRLLQPQAKDKHRVDMRDFGAMISVKEGTPILERIPFTQGVAGYTVTGELIPAKDGQDKQLKAGSGTSLHPNNPDLLIATVAGLPSFLDNSANVEDTLTLKGVDITTGHVDYDGSIMIDGNITPGMRVTATGDITINGYVDSAIVRANGNITITKGVIGRQLESDEADKDELSSQHTTRIISDATIWVAYCQYATLIAQLGVFVERQLTHCNVITPAQVHIGGEGKAAAGKVIGGHLEIADDLYVGQLGAPAGTRTRIYFNVPLHSPEQLEAENNATQVLKDLVVRKRKLIKAKDAFLENPDAFKENFRQTLKKLFIDTEEKIALARQNLLHVREHVIPPAPVRVHINKAMHPGAELLYHDKIKRFSESRGPCTLALIEGQIKIEQ